MRLFLGGLLTLGRGSRTGFGNTALGRLLALGRIGLLAVSYKNLTLPTILRE